MSSQYTLTDIEDTISSDEPMMTEPQRKYLMDLWNGKDHKGVVLPSFDTITKARAHEFIDLLKTFPWKPKPAPEAAPEPVTEGIYKTADGAIYKVQTTQDGEHLYAKRMVVTPPLGCQGHYDRLDGSYFECGVAFPTTDQERLSREGVPVSYEEWPVRDYGCHDRPGTISFEYERGAMHRITAADRMSAEDAKAFGLLYKRCVFCSRRLTDQRSMDAGYGPVCAQTYGLPWGEKEEQS